MADRTTDTTRSEKSAARSDGAAPGPAPTAAGGGIKAWLPLLVTIVAMPALAYATTTFLILPKLQRGPAQKTEGAEPGKGGSAKSEPGKPGLAKTKQTVPITKILVNVKDTMGSRYLMSSITLVGMAADFKARIEENKDQLLDLANSTLSSKTIADLEKPGARNQIRTELLSVINNALGENLVQEIYITEMAIQ